MQINPLLIAKSALKMVNSANVEVVDDFWIDDIRNTPTAILFTKKQKVPGYFSALSRTFKSRGMRFGICNDEGLWNDYNVTSVPTIVLYNETQTVEHEGPLKLRYVKESIRAFFEARESRAPMHADFYVNTELPEVCYDYSVSCVFSYDNYVDPKVDQVRIQFKNDPFRFFVGTDPLPFPGLKPGDFVVFNAKKMSIIKVSDVADLAPALDRVIDGGAKWTPLKNYEYVPEL